MARIRSIKPDFWTDGAIVTLSFAARLLYIGMWNFAICDRGHVADDALKLKLQVLPMDAVDIDALLDELMRCGRVVRVTDLAGRTFLHILRFTDHQKVDPRWASRCPACSQQDSLTLVETPVSVSEYGGVRPNSPNLPQPQPRIGKDRKVHMRESSRFDEFWQVYPLKKGKQAAERNWDRLMDHHVDPEAVISGARAYAMVVANIQDRSKIKYPQGWLNDGRWEDEEETVDGYAVDALGYRI